MTTHGDGLNTRHNQIPLTAKVQILFDRSGDFGLVERLAVCDSNRIQ